MSNEKELEADYIADYLDAEIIDGLNWWDNESYIAYQGSDPGDQLDLDDENYIG